MMGRPCHLLFLFDGPWRELPGQGSVWTQITLRTGQPVARQARGPRSCGQPVLGPAFQGPVWHVGNVLKVSAFQKLKGSVLTWAGGWWEVVFGGNVPLVCNHKGLKLVTLGLCHVRELSCSSDLSPK